jgi:hypothetical protein
MAVALSARRAGIDVGHPRVFKAVKGKCGDVACFCQLCFPNMKKTFVGAYLSQMTTIPYGGGILLRAWGSFTRIP